MSTIALDIRRFDGGSGTVLVSNGIPLRPGDLQAADLAQVRLTIGAAEPALFVKALGRHPDGSVRSLFVQFETSIPDATPIAASLKLYDGTGIRGVTETAVDFAPSTNNDLPAAAVLADARKAGTPAAVALPNTVSHLIACNLVHEIEPVATTAARSQRAQWWSQRWADTLDYWWDKATPMPKYPTGTAPTNNGALSECHIANTNFAGKDLSDASGPNQSVTTGPTPPGYYNWRLMAGSVGSAYPGFNYYDTALVCFARWVATADAEYFRRGCAHAWLYAYYYRWVIKDFGGGTIKVGQNDMQPHAMLPEGVGLHYLLTNDTLAGSAVRYGQGRSFTTLYGSGNWWTGLGVEADWGGEPRPMARILLAHLVAWRVGDATEQAAVLTRIQNAVTKILTGTANRGDGTFRSINVAGSAWLDGAGHTRYYSNFMHAVLLDALQKVANDISAQKAAMLPHMKATLDWLYPHTQDGQLRGADTIPSFQQAYVSPGDPYIAPPYAQSGDLTTMYAPVFTWYARNSGDTDAALYYTKALRILDWGVGNGPMNGNGNGPYLPATASAAQKTKSEQYFSSYRHFGVLSQIEAAGTLTPGTIPEPAVSLGLAPSSAYIDDVTPLTLAASARTYNGLPASSVPSVSYASSVPTIATVSGSGIVTGLLPGNTTITASATAVTPATSAIVVNNSLQHDDFAVAGAPNSTRWDAPVHTGTGSSTTVTGGSLVQTLNNVSSARLNMKNAVDATNRLLRARLAEKPSDTNVFGEVLIVDSTGIGVACYAWVNTLYVRQVTSGGLTGAPALVGSIASWSIGSVTSLVIEMKHSSTTGNFTVRALDDAGATYFTFAALTPPTGFDITTARVVLYSRCGASVAGPLTTKWDSVDLY